LIKKLNFGSLLEKVQSEFKRVLIASSNVLQ
jgi:hypothetical protein